MLAYIDAALVLVISAFILGTSLAMLVRMIRRRRIEDVDNQVSVLPHSIQRWLLGEPRRPK